MTNVGAQATLSNVVSVQKNGKDISGYYYWNTTTNMSGRRRTKDGVFFAMVANTFSTYTRS